MFKSTISRMRMHFEASPVIFLSHTLNGSILLASLGLFISGLAYNPKPGPSEYYSHMATVYLSSLLLFQTLQFIGIKGSKKSYGPRMFWAAHAYFIILIISSLIVGIGYALTPKPDCTALGFLTFADAIAALICLRYSTRIYSDHRHSPSTTSNSDLLELDHSRIANQSKRPSLSVVDINQPRQNNGKHKRSCRRCMGTAWRGFNRFLQLAHLIFIILASSGAIQLALTYRFPNPGKIATINFPTGSSFSFNYNCTTVAPTNNRSAPTIWLEADMAHGIVDFQGLQHYLAVSHGRNSCAYDPPNFGWSQRLPSSQADYYSSFHALLRALGKQDEKMVLVGWGGGAENVVRHADEIPATTTAVVLMDSSPDGIEWMYAAAAQNLTSDEMLAFRSNDLDARIALMQILLGLGIPWGLMSVFNPGNSSGFFDSTLYPRFHAQGLKEDFWAGQYYGLLAMAASPVPDTYLTKMVLPVQIPVYAVMTRNTSATDAFESDFYRHQKVTMAEHIGDGRLAGPVSWCEAAMCSLAFPVNMPEWTANALVQLGI